MNSDETIRLAVQCHKTGNLPRAEQLYKAILGVNPHHPDANHNLGVLLGSQGQWMQAVPLFKTATQALPSEAQYWLSLINAYLTRGDKSAAASSLGDALTHGFDQKIFHRYEWLLDLYKLTRFSPGERIPPQRISDRLKNKKRKKQARTSPSAKLVCENHSIQQKANELLVVYQRGELNVAEEYASLMIQESPDFPFGWKMLGVIHLQTGRASSALDFLKKATALGPKDPEIHNSLGNAFYQVDRQSEAEISYREAIRLRPKYPAAYINLANLLRGIGLHERAEEACRTAIAQKSDYPEAYFNLGNVLYDLNRMSEAEIAYGEAIKLKRDYTEAYSNRGVVLRRLGRLDEAEQSCREAIRLRPDNADAHNNLGKVLKARGCLSGAVESYRQAIRFNNIFAEAHKNLAETYKDLGDLNEAKAESMKAVSILPDYASAYVVLGHIHRMLGDFNASHLSFQTAAQLCPQVGVYKLNAELLLPTILQSNEEILTYRIDFKNAINRLSACDIKFDSLSYECSSYVFDLAYHNYSNRDLMELFHGFLDSKAPILKYESPHIVCWSRPIKRKVRIGICSTFLSGHTIGKLYRGIVEKLDRDRFEVIVIHGAMGKSDVVGKAISRSADRTLRLTHELVEQQCDVAECELDILFYPDIGMSPETYLLAHSRLAPVQCVSWGHPDTTGIRNLDYFLSSELTEKVGAEEHYTERLIRFNRLPCFYEPLPWSMNAPSRQDIGLPEQGTLYGCPQSLFKLHPDFDGILAEILLRDPHGWIILLEGVRPGLVKNLKNRWTSRYPILVERVIFLPRVPYEQFMGLLTQFDVLLDPVHFGSGNTMYESMPFGIPTVTWPGQFMRGRIVAGAYRQMGLSEPPIADSIESYAALAVELGTNRVRREAVKQQILSAVHRELLADDLAVREFEEFFIHAVDAASRGERLPAGWRPQVTKGVLL